MVSDSAIAWNMRFSVMLVITKVCNSIEPVTQWSLELSGAKGVKGKVN